MLPCEERNKRIGWINWMDDGRLIRAVGIIPQSLLCEGENLLTSRVRVVFDYPAR